MAAPVVIVGAGDHARVVLAALRALGAEILGWSGETGRKSLPQEPQFIEPRQIDGMDRSSVELVNGIGSTGKVTLRGDIFERYKTVGFRFRSVIHPTAHLSLETLCGEGIQLMAGAVVQPGARLDDNALVNTGAIVDHDCIVGRHSHIASGAVLSGSVSVGDRTHVGAGAVVRQYIRIGSSSVVGVGTVVISDVANDKTVVGVPARELDNPP